MYWGDYDRIERRARWRETWRAWIGPGAVGVVIGAGLSVAVLYLLQPWR